MSKNQYYNNKMVHKKKRINQYSKKIYQNKTGSEHNKQKQRAINISTKFFSSVKF